MKIQLYIIAFIFIPLAGIAQEQTNNKLTETEQKILQQVAAYDKESIDF